MSRSRRRALWAGAALAALLCSAARADGPTIDKVYHPYIEQLEREIEWRATRGSEEVKSSNRQAEQQRLGFGAAVADNVFVEGYVVAERASGESLDVEAYEGEVQWQLSEQGEYFFDYGVLFELEKQYRTDAWESSTVLLVEKELGSFSATANLALIREWGENIRDEWETSLALQARYRLEPRLEPALELYAGENTRGLGPVIVGRELLGGRRALAWEAGVIFGLDNDTPDHTFRLSLEFEF